MDGPATRIEGDGKKKVIIVAIDESECSAYALDWALTNLKSNIASSGLLLFSVMPVDYSGIMAGSYGAALPELLQSIQENQKKFSEALLEKAKSFCTQKGIEAETVSEFGNPRDAICDAVDKFHAQLLVMGSHGKGAIQRAFLGSVSNYCVHNAKCPVLVVKKQA